jgi:hypothetical protein
MFAFAHHVEVPVEAGVARAVFLRDPARWLPADGGLHGTSEFDGRVRIGLACTPTRFTVGGPWVDGDVVARWIEAAFGGEPGGPPLVHLEGELRLVPGEHGGTRIEFRGTGRGPRHGPRRLLARTFVASVARVIVDAVADRLLAAGRTGDTHGEVPPWPTLR